VNCTLQAEGYVVLEDLLDVDPDDPEFEARRGV
jgi:hypothetical protein